MADGMGRTRTLFAGAGLLAFVALSVLAAGVFRVMGELGRLESRNDGERTMNALFASLWDKDDFGAAVAGSAQLEGKVLGVAAYDAAGTRLAAWGETPASWSEALPQGGGEDEAVRAYVERAAASSLVLLLRPWRLGPPPHPPRAAGEAAGQPPVDEGRGPRPEPPRSAVLDALRRADLVYLEVAQPAFWRAERLRSLLFPAVELVLALGVFAVARLALRNREYRDRIERERNLVILGTAASTIAHEIKNPLLSIRLQTGILSRTLPPGSARELAIIDDEVERLASLSHRVNDYLRDPAGRAETVDVAALAAEAGRRLLGREPAGPAPGAPVLAMIDPERLRSILDNLLRNALESGGSREEVEIGTARDGGTVRVEVLDRGGGIGDGNLERAFDPFFTTKSRGTGIGLAVCRRFAEAAGGKVTLAARPGGGCAAVLSLPCAEEAR